MNIMLYVNRLQEQKEIRSLQKSSDSIVQADIEGLDYGFTECKYYKNTNRLGYPSVEGEIVNNDLHMNEENYLQVIGQVKEYFSKYDDVRMVRDTDEFGEFIEIQRFEV